MLYEVYFAYCGIFWIDTREIFIMFGCVEVNKGIGKSGNINIFEVACKPVVNHFRRNRFQLLFCDISDRPIEKLHGFVLLHGLRDAMEGLKLIEIGLCVPHDVRCEGGPPSHVG